MTINREDAQEFFSELMKENYNYKNEKVAELKDLVKDLRRLNISKGTIKAVLSDVTEDSRIRYNPNIRVGVRIETRLTGLLPSPKYQGLIPSHSGHNCIRPPPDTEVRFEHPVYTFCPNMAYGLSFMGNYKIYNSRALKEVISKRIDMIYGKEN